MQTFKVTFSTIPLSKIPDNKNYHNIIFKNDKVTITEGDAINKLIDKSFVTTKCNINELLEYLAKYSFVPSVFRDFSSNCDNIPLSIEFSVDKNGTIRPMSYKDYSDNCPKRDHVWRSKNNFIECWVILISIDLGHNSLEEFMIKLRNSHYKDCSFIYSSLSNTLESNEIKCGWILDTPITNRKEIFQILEDLMIYFKANHKSEAYISFYYPCKEVLYKNEDALFSPDVFLRLETKSIIHRLNKKEKRIKKSNQNNEIKLVEFIKYMKNIGYDYDNPQKIRNFDFEYALSISKCLQSINSFECSSNTIFMIASNFIHIQSGFKWLKQQMLSANENGLSNYIQKDFQMLSLVKKQCIIPKNFNKSDLDYNKEFKNLLELCVPKNVHIKKYPELKAYSCSKKDITFFVYCIRNSKYEVVYYGRTRNIKSREYHHNFAFLENKTQTKLYNYWREFENNKEIKLEIIKEFDNKINSIRFEMKCILDNYFSDTGFTLKQSIPTIKDKFYHKK